MEGGLRTVKEVMTRFEEKNNDDKEEELILARRKATRSECWAAV